MVSLARNARTGDTSRKACTELVEVSTRDYSTIGFSFCFCTFATTNWIAAIASQTTAAANKSGMNKNEAQNISVPAYSHQGQACWLSVRP
jgi:hypothetical protein